MRIRPSYRLAAAVATWLLVPAAAGAQVPDTTRTDTADTPVFRLQGLEATVSRGVLPESRLAASVTVVDKEQIQRGQLTLDIEESLAQVPGVHVDNRYNLALGSRISIRGFGARSAFGVRGVKLLVDGIPLTVADGQATLSNLPLASAGRVEVWKGPASLLYGNAAGGVISIETEEPPPVPFFGELRASMGDYDAGDLTNFWKIQAKVGGQSRRLTYLAAANRMELDGFREFSSAERTSFNGKLRYAVDGASHVTVILNAADLPLAQNPGSLPLDAALATPRMAWPNNVRTGSSEAASQVQGGIGYIRALGEGRLDVTAWGLTRDLENPLPFGRFIDLGRTGGGARASFRTRGELARREVAVTTGVDLELQRDDREERDNVDGRRGDQLFRDQVDRVTAVGPFARGQIALSEFLELSAGLRYDAVHFSSTDHLVTAGGDLSGDRTLDQLSYSVGALIIRDPRISVFGNVATSFQTPTTTELINAPPGPGEDCCPGGFNRDLEPQTATSFEVGARGRLAAGGLAYEMALYTMSVEDLLIPFQIEEAEAREFFRNAGATRHRGFELGLGARLDRVDLSAGYTYSDFRFREDASQEEDFEDNRIPGVPPHRLALEAAVSLPAATFVEANLEWVDETHVNDANTATNPAYTVVDLRGGTTIEMRGWALQPFAGVGNLFDERYNASVVINAFGGRFYEPGPGRNFFLGMTVPIGAH